MLRTQIYLTEKERKGLHALADQTGKKQSELIREAVDRLIEMSSISHRKDILNSAAGIWQHRTDLPDFDATRQSWDRS